MFVRGSHFPYNILQYSLYFSLPYRPRLVLLCFWELIKHCKATRLGVELSLFGRQGEKHKKWYLFFSEKPRNSSARIKSKALATHVIIFTLYSSNTACKYIYFIGKFNTEMLVITLLFTNGKNQNISSIFSDSRRDETPP